MAILAIAAEPDLFSELHPLYGDALLVVPSDAGALDEPFSTLVEGLVVWSEEGLYKWSDLRTSFATQVGKAFVDRVERRALPLTIERKHIIDHGPFAYPGYVRHLSISAGFRHTDPFLTAVLHLLCRELVWFQRQSQAEGGEESLPTADRKIKRTVRTAVSADAKADALVSAWAKGDVSMLKVV